MIYCPVIPVDTQRMLYAALGTGEYLISVCCRLVSLVVPVSHSRLTVLVFFLPFFFLCKKKEYDAINYHVLSEAFGSFAVWAPSRLAAQLILKRKYSLEEVR